MTFGKLISVVVVVADRIGEFFLHLDLYVESVLMCVSVYVLVCGCTKTKRKPNWYSARVKVYRKTQQFLVI